MLVVFIPDFQYCFEVGNKETWLLNFFSHTGGDDCDCERLKPLPKSRSALRYHFSGTSTVRRACVENAGRLGQIKSVSAATRKDGTDGLWTGKYYTSRSGCILLCST